MILLCNLVVFNSCSEKYIPTASVYRVEEENTSVAEVESRMSLRNVTKPPVTLHGVISDYHNLNCAAVQTTNANMLL
jgi:hypothetical protein